MSDVFFRYHTQAKSIFGTYVNLIVKRSGYETAVTVEVDVQGDWKAIREFFEWIDKDAQYVGSSFPEAHFQQRIRPRLRVMDFILSPNADLDSMVTYLDSVGQRDSWGSEVL